MSFCTIHRVATVTSAVLIWGCATHYQQKLVYSTPEIQQRVEALHDTLEAQPEDVATHIELGRLLLTEDYPLDAITDFEYAIEVDSQNAQAYLLLASALLRKRNSDLNEAASVLEQASRVLPEHADVRLNLAYIYSELGQIGPAIEEFKTVKQLTDDLTSNLSAHLGLVAAYKRQGQEEKADAELEQARIIFPNVDELIRNIEINQLTPPPRYAGDEFLPRDGMHFPLEVRIELVHKEIERIKSQKGGVKND